MMVFRLGKIVLQLIFCLWLFTDKFGGLFFRLFKVVKLLGSFLRTGVIFGFAFNTIITNALGIIFTGRLCGLMVVSFCFLLYKEWNITIFILLLVIILIIIWFFMFRTWRYLVRLSVIFGLFVGGGDVVVDYISHIIVYVIVYYCDISTCVICV
jgi:hypothetical protein